MKIFKKISILSLTAIGALLVVSCSSNSNSSNESSNTTGDSNSLRVTLTDGKLSDASRQNMIKAEYLIKMMATRIQMKLVLLLHLIQLQ